MPGADDEAINTVYSTGEACDSSAPFVHQGQIQPGCGRQNRIGHLSDVVSKHGDVHADLSIEEGGVDPGFDDWCYNPNHHPELIGDCLPPAGQGLSAPTSISPSLFLYLPYIQP